MTANDSSRKELKGLPPSVLEQGLDPHECLRLEFLSKAGQQLSGSHPNIARLYSTQHRKLLRVQLQSKELPTDGLCSACSLNFVPGANCTIRIKNRSKLSPAVKRVHRKAKSGQNTASGRASKQVKGDKHIRNEVIYTCHLCQSLTSLPGAYEAPSRLIKRKTPSKGNTQPDSASSGRNSGNVPSSNKKLKSAGESSSKDGAKSKLPTPGSSSNTKRDSISLKETPKELSLLEQLERDQKQKKRKKSLTSTPPANLNNNNAAQGGSSLGRLKALFQG